MLADFVSKRGGSLLMLGGRRSFAEGGWGGTPVGDVLPVVMGAANSKYFTELTVRPTRAGSLTPVTQIAATDEASSSKWNDMPDLSTVNLIREVKPGATVLLTGVDKARQDHVVLAFQRYGRGKAFAMATTARRSCPTNQASTTSASAPSARTRSWARRRCRYASRPGTRSTSTPRCARRCSSGSPKTPADDSSRRRPPRGCPKRSATA